jgi:hypothetical protein
LPGDRVENRRSPKRFLIVCCVLETQSARHVPDSENDMFTAIIQQEPCRCKHLSEKISKKAKNQGVTPIVPGQSTKAKEKADDAK